MNNALRPKVREQADPWALEFVERFMPVPEGYDVSGAPLFTGIPEAIWERMVKHAEFHRFYSVLMADFPTFCLFVEKIWAKRIGRLMPLVFNRTQRLLWNRMAWRIAHGLVLFLVILKARQLGASTVVNAFAHWNIWRLHDVEVTLVVHEKPLAYSFMDRLRIFHEELPHVRPILRTLRQQAKTARVPRDEMYYNENRSKVTTVVAKQAEARGRSSPHYHLAEYAFYERSNDLLNSLLPQLPPIGSPARLQCSVIVESTPNGRNNFHALWTQANTAGSEWDPQFFPWYVAEDEYSLEPPEDWAMTPERAAWALRLSRKRKEIDGVGTISPAQIYWYEFTLENECDGDQDKMDREYPSDPETCFLLRSRGIFRDDMRFIQQCVSDAEAACSAEWKKRGVDFQGSFARGTLVYKKLEDPFMRKIHTQTELKLDPTFVFDGKGPLWVWSPPQVGHDYVIGIDVAAGTFAGDWSVAEVFDVTEGKQAAELWYKCSPEQLTDDCAALGYWYNTAVLYPEVNSIGSVVMKRLKIVWHYPRVGREERWDEVALKEKKYGHYTTDESKAIMVSFLKHVISERFLAVSSMRLLGELSTFIETATGGFEADTGSHDDCVMASCLAMMVVRQAPAMLVSLTKTKHRADPNQMTDMIFDAPKPLPELRFQQADEATAAKRIPDEVRKVLEGNEILGMPANPIAGDGIGVGLPQIW